MGEADVPENTDDLEELVRKLMGRVDQLTDELTALRDQGSGAVRFGGNEPSAPAAPRGPDQAALPTEPLDAPKMSRRGALALGAAAAAGIGALSDSVLFASPAGATTGFMQFGASNDAGTTETDLTSSATTETLSVVNTGSGEGIDVMSAGGAAAIKATSNGIFPAVYARSVNPSSGEHGVFSEIYGLGTAVVGNIDNSSNSSAAIEGFTAGLGIGVKGWAQNASGTSPGVYGLCGGSGAGVAGLSTSGYGLSGQGGLAPLFLAPAASVGAPSTGTHAVGELYVDSNGVQYRCAAAGTPGTWVPQYSVVPLFAPVRVIATPSGTGGISGPLIPGATVHTSSVLTGANGIPEGAIGIVGNLAVSGVGNALLNGFGVMTIFPAGESAPATANINAGAGCFALSNAVTVAFGTGGNAGEVSLVWNGGGPVPSVQAYLDVIAYIL